MIKQNVFKSSTTSLVVILLLLTTTTTFAQTPRRVAKDFVKSLQKHNQTVLVQEPGFVYKYNLKKSILAKYNYANKEQRDSLLWVHSLFIQHINDSTFLSYFIKGFTDELRKFDLRPYVKKMPAGLNQPDYVISLAQVELEEQYYPFADSTYFNNKALVFKKKLNALDVSSWFLIHPGSQVKKDTIPLFAESLLSDMITDGNFFMQNKNGKYVYYYKMDHLTIKKIYDYVQNLGRIYAGYAFDYILNEHLKKVLPESKLKNEYWHYDPYNDRLYTGEGERFIKVKGQ